MERRKFMENAALGTAASTALLGCGSDASG